jgi:hypothetical protein
LVVESAVWWLASSETRCHEAGSTAVTRGRSFEWSDALVVENITRAAGLFGAQLGEWRDWLASLTATQSGNRVDA